MRKIDLCVIKLTHLCFESQKLQMSLQLLLSKIPIGKKEGEGQIQCIQRDCSD